MEKVYEDDHVRVMHFQGNSDYIAVTFGDILDLADGLDFSARKPLVKSNISCIGIVAKIPNWYPVSSMRNAAAVIRPLLENFSNRVGLGGSMGGYGAIKHSSLLNLTHVAALAPQWSLDKKECNGNDPGWQQYYVPSMEGMGIVEGDVTGRVTVFMDPYNGTDAFHLGRIMRAHPETYVIPIPSVGHHVTHVLAGTQNLVEIIEGCLASDRHGLRSVIRRARRLHPVRVEQLVERCLARHRSSIPRVLVSAFSHDRLNPTLGAHYISDIVGFCLKKGNAAQASEILRQVGHEIDRASTKIMMNALLSEYNKSPARLCTQRSSFIQYNVIDNCCYHQGGSAGEPGSVFPVEVSIRGNQIDLSIMMGGVRMYMSAGGHNHLTFEMDRQTPFKVEGQPDGTFSISHEGLYLCAEDRGQLHFSRGEVAAWEKFQMS